MFPTNLARAALVSLLAAGLTAPVAQGFEVDLQPTTIEMSADPGQRQRHVIRISNSDSQEPVSMTIGLADWTLDRDGQIKLVPPGERPESGSEWARFTPSFVTLEPGESQNIIVDIITPARLDRTGDYRFALLASAILPDRQARQSGILRKYQVASLIYLTTPDASSHPAIRDVRLTVGDDGADALNLMLENTGNAHARLNGTVTIEGRGERVDIPISNLVVLEDSEREFEIRLEGRLPADPRVTVNFENIFAPQAEKGVMPVKTYAAPLSMSGGARLSALLD